MAVSQELLKELSQIIREDYRVELSQKDLSRVANDLVGFGGMMFEKTQKEVKKEKK